MVRTEKVCQSCKKGKLIEGTLEGVSFQPLSEGKKWLSSGVYGIHALVCLECGLISDLSVDTKALEKLTRADR
jgi:hypothetical protein